MSDPAASVPGVIIDCGQCTVRGAACTDCVVTFLTIGVGPGRRDHDQPRASGGPGTADLDAAERDAIAVLAKSGLVPPLRLARDEPQRRVV